MVSEGTTMSTASALYPPGGLGAPKHRRGHAHADIGLPARIVSGNIKKFLSV
jgi:hypothetical protein